MQALSQLSYTPKTLFSQPTLLISRTVQSLEL